MDLSLSRTSSKVSRALIGKLGISSLTSSAADSVPPEGSDEREGGGDANFETGDLNHFVAKCGHGSGAGVADSVKRLWDPVAFGKSAGGRRKTKISKRRAGEAAGEDASAASGDGRRGSDRETRMQIPVPFVVSASEGEMTGTGTTPRGILRGVRDSAGKATRLLGDGLG